MSKNVKKWTLFYGLKRGTQKTIRFLASFNKNTEKTEFLECLIMTSIARLMKPNETWGAFRG